MSAPGPRARGRPLDHTTGGSAAAGDSPAAADGDAIRSPDRRDSPLPGPTADRAGGPGGTSAALAYRDVGFRYGAAEAVRSVTLAVQPGEMFGLIGPDGAGKTTTLRLGLGLLRPHGGEVRTLGLDPVADHHELSDRVGYLSQRFSLYGDLSVDENVAFFARIHGVSGWKERREELLELVRMAPFRRRLADRLSGGMKQKLALACTLIHTPELLILDEPTTGVDPVSRRDFWKLLARLQADGLTIVMTTPYLDEAERCQRVALMHRGTLLAVDDPHALRDGFPAGVVELVVDRPRQAAECLRQAGQVEQVETFGGRLHVFVTSEADAVGLAGELARQLEEAGVAVVDSRAVEPSLEDVFIARIREADEVEPVATGGSR